MRKIQMKDMPLSSGPQYAGFVERLFYRSLESNLKTGEMSTVLNGKIVPLADAQRIVPHARTYGWLPPKLGSPIESGPVTRAQLIISTGKAPQHGSILRPSTVTIFQINIECSLSLPRRHLIVKLQGLIADKLSFAHGKLRFIVGTVRPRAAFKHPVRQTPERLF